MELLEYFYHNADDRTTPKVQVPEAREPTAPQVPEGYQKEGEDVDFDDDTILPTGLRAAEGVPCGVVIMIIFRGTRRRRQAAVLLGTPLGDTFGCKPAFRRLGRKGTACVSKLWSTMAVEQAPN